MQKFCGKCGAKLNKDDKVCSKCNTPTHGNEPKKMDIAVKILIIFGIVVLSIIVILVSVIAKNQYKISKFKHDYVEPFVKENYKGKEYEIEYRDSGRCLLDGDCYFDLMQGCDGAKQCKKYVYSDDSKCVSHYFSVKNDDELFTVTVVDNHGKISVVEGKNIYGKDARTTNPITTTTTVRFDYNDKTTTNAINN